MKNRDYIDRLYASSKRLFVENGYDAVTMDEICESAGVSKPTAYAAKLTKPVLLARLYRPDLSESLSADPKADPLGSIADHLDRLLDRIFSYGPDLLRDLFRLELDGRKPDYFIERAWYFELIERIEHARTAGLIDNQEEAESLAGMVANFLIGYSFEYSISSADEKRENLYEGVRCILRVRRIDHAN